MLTLSRPPLLQSHPKHHSQLFVICPQRPGCQNRSSSALPRSRIRFSKDPAADAASAPGSQSMTPEKRQQKSVLLTAEDNYDAMCTMLGDLNKERLCGYAGQWRTWEVTPQTPEQPDSQPIHAAAAISTSIGSPGISSGYGTHLIDSSINIRLWQLLQEQQPEGSADAAASSSTALSPDSPKAQTAVEGGGHQQVTSMERMRPPVQQANFYQQPGKMAGPSTRFAPYLTGNTMSGRPDGYGLRVWTFTTGSELLQSDASAWLADDSTPERSMRVLTVPNVATTIINGALPSGFVDDHQPKYWVLEFIVKETGSSDRRWASINWYELGQLVVNRSINEDMTEMPGKPDDIMINPDDIIFSKRRDGLLPLGIDTWAAQNIQVSNGTSTQFSYKSPQGAASGPSRAALQLTMASGMPCTWANPFIPAHLSTPAPPPASPETLGDPTPGAQRQQQQQRRRWQQQQQEELDLVVQVYPDWSYCRVPRDLSQAVASGAGSVTFEAGTVLRDGSLVRWLLDYDTTGKRLVRTATFESYPPAL